jgi:subtilisin-like proprotein convertase family protein
MPSHLHARRLALVLVAAALPVAGLAPQPASAAATTDVYTNLTPTPLGGQVAYATGPGTTINDSGPFHSGTATPYPSAAKVDGLTGTVVDVNLSLFGFTHGRPRDVDVMLVAPGGRRAVVMSDVGGFDPVSNVYVGLDDQGAPIPAEAKLDEDDYHPTNGEGDDEFLAPAPDPTGAPSALSTFDGIDGNGTWQLFVVDDLGSYTGSIASWSITVTTSVDAGNPSAISVPAAPRRVTDVDVYLNGVRHLRPGDLDLLLVGPRGQQATILSDAGGDTAVDGVDLVLDDEAATAVGSALTGGSYRPTNLEGSDYFPSPAPVTDGSSALSVFDGTDPAGTWRLFYADDFYGAGGRLDSWYLKITTVDAPTAPVVVTEQPTVTANASPRVISTRPAARTTGVRRGADVTATGSERLRASTVTGRSVYLVRRGSTTHVRATVSWRPDTDQIVVDPRKRLRGRTTYLVVITTAVKDVAGARLDQDPAKDGLQRKTWRFTTR